MTGKRKLRRICGWILSVIIALMVCGLMMIGLFQFGIYRTDRLNDSISKSGYLEERYEEFETEVRKILNESELPEDLLKREEIQDRFLMDLKKQILGNDSQEEETWLKRLAEEKIREYLLNLDVYTTDQSEAGISALAENLQGAETRYTQIPEMDAWREQQADFLRQGKRMSFLMVGILAATLAVAAGIQHTKSRVLDIAGRGGLFGSILMAAVVCAILYLKGNAGGELAEIVWEEAAKAGFFISVSGAGTSICLWMAGKLFRRVKK